MRLIETQQGTLWRNQKAIKHFVAQAKSHKAPCYTGLITSLCFGEARGPERAAEIEPTCDIESAFSLRQPNQSDLRWPVN